MMMVVAALIYADFHSSLFFWFSWWDSQNIITTATVNKYVTGPYYLWMVREVADALSKLETLFPAYADIGSYEVSGLVWHQGWNDVR